MIAHCVAAGSVKCQACGAFPLFIHPLLFIRWSCLKN